MTSPFIIYSLPRSRSAWLSRYLTYGDWACSHEEMRHARSLDDVRAWFSQPFTGTVETAGAPWWRLVQKMAPGIRTVVVRRPVAEVVDSLNRTGMDGAALAPAMERLDAKLAQIEARVPGVLSVHARDLSQQDACAVVFEHCLQQPHDPAWWAAVSPVNIQISIPLLHRYFQAYKGQIEKLRQKAHQVSLQDLHRGAGYVPDAVTISEEPFESYFPGAIDEIRKSAIGIGEGAAYPNSMNFDAMRELAQAGRLQTVIARSNGKVFGFLLTVLQPCFVDGRITEAHHTTIWTDEQFPLLGMRMMRSANEILKGKGVGQIIMRAGTRGDGPRLGKLYRYLGAQECGALWRLELENAA